MFMIIFQDFTVFGGSLSMAHANKICKVSQIKIKLDNFCASVIYHISIIWIGLFNLIFIQILEKYCILIDYGQSNVTWLSSHWIE